MKKLLIGGGLAVFAFVLSTSFSFAASSVVYDALPSISPQTSYPSQPFQAQQVREFGDEIHLGGTSRMLNSVIVTMVTWARHSEYPGMSSTGWSHPITLNVYRTDLNADGTPSTKIGEVTQDIFIPWRPEGDSSCPNTGYGDGFAWKDDNGTCRNGLAFNANFDLSSLNLVLPDDIIVTVAFNTQTWGYEPINAAGPYNSLNVAVPENQTTSFGSNDSDSVFLNSTWAGAFSNSSLAGKGLQEDSNWSPYGTVALQVTANVAKVDICHLENKKSNKYHLISVSENAVAAHTKHGDKMPGEDVSEMSDKKFAEDCSIIEKVWTKIDTVTVPSNNVTGASSNVDLVSGKAYKLKASGTWTNSNNIADAEYISKNDWTDHADGYNVNPYLLGAGAFDLQVGEAFVDWGEYSPAHVYEYPYAGTGNKVNFRIFDGDSNGSFPNAGWYGDNSGSLTVDIYVQL